MVEKDEEETEWKREKGEGGRNKDEKREGEGV